MKQHQGLLRELKANGYIIEKPRTGHIKVRRPNGSYLMTISGSPSDINAERNTRQRLRRLGVEL